MAKTLQQILGYVYLTGLVEDIKTGVPDILPPAFWNLKTETLGDQGRYTRYAGTRQTARRVEYGSSSRKRQLSAIGSFDVKLNHLFEHIDLDVKLYQSLRAYNDYKVQRMGMEEVERQAFQFRALFDNTRRSMVYSMLSKGAIYWDSDGNLLPSSSGASLTIDYGLGANNQNQLNGIIGTSWATASADIVGDLRQIKQASMQLTGYEPKYAFYGIDIPKYLSENTTVQAYLSRNPQTHQKWLDTGEIPDGLFGYTWVPAYMAFYQDDTGTNQTWWAADKITFCPEPDNMLYELMEGTYPVPKSFMPMATLQNTIDSFDLRTGMFGYGLPIQDPMTARLYFGDTSLPIWKIPDALYIADVAP